MPLWSAFGVRRGGFPCHVRRPLSPPLLLGAGSLRQPERPDGDMPRQRKRGIPALTVSTENRRCGASHHAGSPHHVAWCGLLFRSHRGGGAPPWSGLSLASQRLACGERLGDEAAHGVIGAGTGREDDGVDLVDVGQPIGVEATAVDLHVHDFTDELGLSLLHACSVVSDSCDPPALTRQAPLSMGFPR